MITKEKRFLKYILLAGLLFITGCGQAEPAASMDQTEMPDEDANKLLYVTETDRNEDFDDPVYLDLSEMQDVVITTGGEYMISGEYHQTLKVDAHDGIVHLIFDNVNIQTSVGPALYVASGGKVVVTLMQDSVNNLFDAAYYDNEDLSGAISSECDLTINGLGTLNVCGYYKDAIHTKDVCKILDADVQLKAKRYGIKGNDGILLAPSNLVIESEKNGCQTTNANKEDKGVIDIRMGKISIIAGEYALSAASDVFIRGDEVYLNSVIGDIYTEGQQAIAEGALIDE